MQWPALIVLVILLTACSTSTSSSSLYEQIGGSAGTEKLVDAFIQQIGNDELILPYFTDTNVRHFRQGFINHLCDTLDGPCRYEGDNMVQIHTGMRISEADFNRVVDLLINAMNEVGIPQRVQNQILARLASLRGDIIYL
ncbi:group I truncated hemoglobin [Pseudoalteromonas peptidolytica]|uniref:group I truncated hemoglobin n=1 Tax=Pseudoalteromonas peptidolytica TaxID=61150 RepID=UPI00298ECD74|nr:group 1 truncated hemoglobin [Pseudoalteromonas peptidolytica]MDW7550371.1 group 1 truncated hemoglobin [Pseudoalteromonas peptidolytica]